MGQTTGFLTKPLTATVRVPARTLVKFGAADGTGVPAVDGASFIFGVSGDIDAEVGERISVHSVANIADAVYGGNLTRGMPVTADAQGRAVQATTAGTFCVGFAEVSGAAGDIGTVIVAPHIL
jgi:hypothetical protein